MYYTVHHLKSDCNHMDSDVNAAFLHTRRQNEFATVM